MMKRVSLVLCAFFVGLQALNAQNVFDITVKKVDFTGIKGVQSFAWGKVGNKVLIVGGRIDGLHQRQPFASFAVTGQNTQFIVMDLENMSTYTSTISDLSVEMKDQFSATNFQFFQQDNILYITGGYGYSQKSVDHITHPYISRLNVSKIIDSVILNKGFKSCIQQKYDTMFAVTGGSLNKINSTYYLSGGHKFTGRYNPMGPDHGPGFTQLYTNAIRKFNIIETLDGFQINHLKSHYDAGKLHRRDFNVMPQIYPNGTEGLTLFSGVFRPDEDLPFLSAIDLDSQGYNENKNFSQFYNHYHCAHLGLFDNQSHEMHNLFFGGIAQFYDSAGVLVQDNNVPFVKTIGLVSRSATGELKEFKMASEMPGYLGAGSEFIPLEELPHYQNDVMKLDQLNFEDSIKIGYIFGGIQSNKPNIFFSNNIESKTSTNFYEVYLHKNKNIGIKKFNPASNHTLKLQIFPIPNYGDLLIKFELVRKSMVKITIKDQLGKMIDSNEISNLDLGENQFSKSVNYLTSGGIYIVEVETNYEKELRKIIVE